MAHPFLLEHWWALAMVKYGDDKAPAWRYYAVYLQTRPGGHERHLSALVVLVPPH